MCCPIEASLCSLGASFDFDLGSLRWQAGLSNISWVEAQPILWLAASVKFVLTYFVQDSHCDRLTGSSHC